MPPQFDLMLPVSLSHVAHQPELPLPMENPPTVRDRLRQARISIMAARKQIKVAASDPALDFDERWLRPAERIPALCLIRSIHLHRVVSRSPAIPPALLIVS